MSDETNDEINEAADDQLKAASAPAAAVQSSRRNVAVPAWAMALVALLAVGGLGFGVARWTDSGGESYDHRPPAGGMVRHAPAGRGARPGAGGQDDQRGPDGRG